MRPHIDPMGESPPLQPGTESTLAAIRAAIAEVDEILDARVDALPRGDFWLVASAMAERARERAQWAWDSIPPPRPVAHEL